MVRALYDGHYDIGPYDLLWQASRGANDDLLHADLCRIMAAITVTGNLVWTSSSGIESGTALFHDDHRQRPSMVIRLASITYTSDVDSADTTEIEWASEPMTMRDRVDDIRAAAGLPEFQWRHTPRMADLDLSRGTFPVDPKMLVEIMQALGRFAFYSGQVYQRTMSVFFTAYKAGIGGDDFYRRAIDLVDRSDTAFRIRCAMRSATRRRVVYDRPGHIEPPAWGEVRDYTSHDPLDVEYEAPEPYGLPGFAIPSSVTLSYHTMADEYARYRCAASGRDDSRYAPLDWAARNRVSHSIAESMDIDSDLMECATDAFFVGGDEADETYHEDMDAHGDEPDFEQHFRHLMRWSSVACETWATGAPCTWRYFNEPQIPDRLPRLSPDAWFQSYGG